MRRQINLRLLAALLAGVAALGVGGCFLHGYQVKRQAGILLAQAEKAQADGKLDTAVAYLSRYLAIAPKDSPKYTDALEKKGTLLADPKLAKSPRALLQ